MTKNLPQYRPSRTFTLPPRWRWLTVTVFTLGGGTSTVLLIQEETLTLESLGPVAAIPLLGAPIVWLVKTIFNCAALPSDRQRRTRKGSL